MLERRQQRSEDRDEALQHLMDHLAATGGGRGVALIDERGRLLAGAGRPEEMWAVAKAAGGPGERIHLRGESAARAHIEAQDESLRLAAISSCLPDDALRDAARSVARILAATHP